MSDSAGSDDGGIDKEALREELREKYEQDERERESTQRMSDLLLKGATMTNAHCGVCGDPFFEQNGTTFCPSCHGGPEGVEASIEEAGAAGNAQAAPGTSTEADAPAEADATGEPATRATADVEIDTDARTRIDGVETDQFTVDESTPSTETADRPARPTIESTQRSSASPATGSVPAASGDLAGGRDALVAALDRFAREAAETDDPRYARECLEAAREAAEALAALER